MNMTCWYCDRPILAGESAHRAPRGLIAVHAECLRADARNEGLRPADDDLPADPLLA